MIRKVSEVEGQNVLRTFCFLSLDGSLFAARSGELDCLTVTVVHSDFPKMLVSMQV